VLVSVGCKKPENAAGMVMGMYHDVEQGSVFEVVNDLRCQRCSHCLIEMCCLITACSAICWSCREFVIMYSCCSQRMDNDCQ
jgi:hypothetical protein